MHQKPLWKILQNIEAENELVEYYDSKKEELKVRPYKSSHIYMGLFAGTMVGMITASYNVLDSGAMILGGIFGGIAGASIPALIRHVKIGELNYQIFMNEKILDDLNLEKENLKKQNKILKRV